MLRPGMAKPLFVDSFLSLNVSKLRVGFQYFDILCITLCCFAHCRQVSPCDGRVLHFGPADEFGVVEQVKGVTYPLKLFLGQGVLPQHLAPASSTASDSSPEKDVSKQNGVFNEDGSKHRLYHCVLYLGPGDYHHYHSPTDWTVELRNHFPGES